jgi:predicted enzyme related to lactoylglutathione lyase
MKVLPRRPCSFGAALLICALALLPGRSHAAGEIYWFMLLSEDPIAAIRFYSNLFGWQIETGPTGGWLMMRNGTPFAGINKIEDRIPGAAESVWLAAINVADLPSSVRTAKSLGATINRDVTDVAGWGSFAVIQDPQGAPLMLVRPQRPLGGNQGYSGWRWAELWTPDTAAAESFYAKVIGYKLEHVTLAGETYNVFGADGKRNAGLVKLDRPGVAPRWAPYVGVTDLKGILVRVWQNEGKVLREPAELDFAAAGANRVALITDNTGAALFLYQLDERATPDPGVVAEVNPGGMRSQGARAAAQGGEGPNVSFTLTYSTGFGPGWDSMYPTLPYRSLGPIP